MTKHNTDLRAALAARPERFRIPISQLTPDMQLMPESRARASYAPPLQHSRTPLLSVRSRTHGALDQVFLIMNVFVSYSTI